MALDKLVIDTGTQIRSEISEHIVAEYVEALGEGARFPPIVVFRNNGSDVLADGFHRVQAYKKAGRTEIWLGRMVPAAMVAATRRMSAQFLSIRSAFTLPPTRGRSCFGTPARSNT